LASSSQIDLPNPKKHRNK